MVERSTSTSRYSDQELNEFKNHIEQKILTSQEQVKQFEERIDNISEINDNDGDWMDDSSNIQDLEMLYSLVSRQKKHIQDLKNALIRVHNKSYGICILTGQLIDKRRLMAVPTTAKSLAAKIAPVEKTRYEDEEDKKPKPTVPAERVIISKVIKRTGGTPPVKPKEEEEIFLDEDLDDDDSDFDIDFDATDEIDLDSIADESTIED